MDEAQAVQARFAQAEARLAETEELARQLASRMSRLADAGEIEAISALQSLFAEVAPREGVMAPTPAEWARQIQSRAAAVRTGLQGGRAPAQGASAAPDR